MNLLQGDVWLHIDHQLGPCVGNTYQVNPIPRAGETVWLDRGKGEELYVVTEVQHRYNFPHGVHDVHVFLETDSSVTDPTVGVVSL